MEAIRTTHTIELLNRLDEETRVMWVTDDMPSEFTFCTAKQQLVFFNDRLVIEDITELEKEEITYYNEDDFIKFIQKNLIDDDARTVAEAEQLYNDSF